MKRSSGIGEPSRQPDFNYASGHEPLLRRALVRLGIWKDRNRPLPNPENVAHGVAGRSCVYFLFIPSREGTGRYLVAKFDEDSRSSREWSAVQDLRQLDNPPEVVLPLMGNEPDDRVIIFPAVEGMSGHIKCLPLLDLFDKQLEKNPKNLSVALDKLFDVLGMYYQSEPGAARFAKEGDLIRWASAYPNLEDPKIINSIYSTAYKHWPSIDWRSTERFTLPETDQSVLNPFPSMQAMLRERTGPIMLSRIHGDLNLTNVIVALTQKFSPKRVFVIDIANSEPNKIQATDFAKMETEIWRQLAASGKPESIDDLLKELVVARNFLDGRSLQSPLELSAAMNGALIVVNHLRRFAKHHLKPSRNPGHSYLLEDYFRSMYFASLNALKFEDVRESRATSGAMILSAALSLEFIRDVESGLYSPGSTQDRWPPPRSIKKKDRVYSGSKIQKNLEPLLANPYPMPANFTGRHSERATLSDWLRFGPEPISVLTAIGGMGKSAVAWAWLLQDVLGKEMPGTAHRHSPRYAIPKEERPEGALWFSFYEPGATFNAFLDKALGYTRSSGSGTDSKVVSLIEALQERKFVLVLDGFERELVAYAKFNWSYQNDDIDIAPEYRDCIDPLAAKFLRTICSLPAHSKVLITSRLLPKVLEGHDSNPLAGCQHHALEGLTLNDAVEFFQAQGIKASSSEIAEACEPYGGHPLTLRLLSGMILHDSEKPGDLSKAHQFDPIANLRQRRRHVLEQSYNSLRSEDRELLSRIACFRFSSNFDSISAASPAASSGSIRAGIRTLDDRGFLFIDRSAGRFSLHPVIKLYAYARLTAKREVHELLSSYFERFPVPESVSGVEDLSTLIECYDHTLRSGRPDDAWKLFPILIERFLYYQLGEYQLATELLRELLPQGEEGAPILSKVEDQGGCFSILGVIRSRMGQPSRAIRLGERALQLYSSVEAKSDMAIQFGNLSNDYLKMGRIREAQEALEERLRLAQEIGNLHSEMTARQELGRVLIYRGCYSEALEEIMRAREHWRVSSSPHAHHGLSLTEAFLALRFLFVGDAEGALRHAIESRRNAQLERNIIQSEWLTGLAMVQISKEESNLLRAEEHLSEAMRRCRRIRLVEFEPEIMLALAVLYRERGERRLSFTSAEDSLSVAEECEYRLQQAEAHIFLAEMAIAMRNTEVARHEAELARVLAKGDRAGYDYKRVLDLVDKILRLVRAPESLDPTKGAV